MKLRKQCKNCRNSFLFEDDREVLIHNMRCTQSSPEQIDMRVKANPVPMFCNICAARLLGVEFIAMSKELYCWGYASEELKRAVELGIEKSHRPSTTDRHKPYEVML